VAVGTALDVWDLGLIIYVLLTGKAFFAAATDSEDIEGLPALVAQTLERSEGVDESTRQLLTRMLSVDPSERPSLKSVLKGDFLQSGHDRGARRRLCYVHNDEPIIIPPAKTTFHIFLSHVWRSSADAMRVIKNRLAEMVPELRVFLDVDDLRNGLGAGYVDQSDALLCALSVGYFESPNAIRELLRAVVTGKPIIALTQSAARAEGKWLTRELVRSQLREAEGRYEQWGLVEDMADWGVSPPSAADVEAAIFARPPIEWMRINHLQDVTLRLIIEQLLSQTGSNRGGLYLQGECAREKLVLSPPSMGQPYHLYVSPSNSGASELVEELRNVCNVDLRATSDMSCLGENVCFLVCLRGDTWTAGEQGGSLAAELVEFCNMKPEGTFLLAHEAPCSSMADDGLHDGRCGVEFDELVEATPDSLRQLGMYNLLATTLMGGSYRKTSLVMLCHALEAKLKSDGQADGSSPRKQRRATSEGTQLVENRALLRNSLRTLHALRAVRRVSFEETVPSSDREGTSLRSSLRLPLLFAGMHCEGT